MKNTHQSSYLVQDSTNSNKILSRVKLLFIRPLNSKTVGRIKTIFAENVMHLFKDRVEGLNSTDERVVYQSFTVYD